MSKAKTKILMKTQEEKYQSERKGWPSGFEVIGPNEYQYHAKIISTLREVATLYGYCEIQTPRVVDVAWVQAKSAGSEEIKSEMFTITRFGQEEPSPLVLVFEHTLSLAKYLAFQGQQIKYPFRRIEVGPVFRGERSQKGRKREFVQADVDAVGLPSPWGEVEVISIMSKILDRLGFPAETKIHVNDRRLLVSLISVIEAVDNLDIIGSLLRLMDKLDREPLERILHECQEKDLPGKAISEIVTLANLSFSAQNPVEAVNQTQEIIKKKGWFGKKVEVVLNSIKSTLTLLGSDLKRVVFDPRLTRGLDYYTGTVFEIHHPGIGYSLCGGGRYDKLTEVLGGPKNVPAIGFSFGVDRMALTMKSIGISEKMNTNNIAVISFGKETVAYSFEIASIARELGFTTVLVDPTKGKIGDQMKRAAEEGFLFSLIIGESETQNRTITIKNMVTREQIKISLEGLKTELEKLKVANS